jgi:hypothetical protein
LLRERSIAGILAQSFSAVREKPRVPRVSLRTLLRADNLSTINS